MTEQDLKDLERATFRATTDSGLWDMVLASVIAMLAIAPLLSPYLGDFWSAAVFLPVWAVVFVAIHLVQRRIILPRIGHVEFAPSRKKRLAGLSIIMLVVNVIALVLGFVAYGRGGQGDAAAFAMGLPLTFLLGGSLVALFLEIPRVFVYGVLLASAAVIGEALWSRGMVSHHGFPVMFGTCAVVILVSGIVRFVRFLPPPPDGVGDLSPGGNHE
jgi:hypothetical protein